MAFFSPLGAISAFGSGALKGATDEAPKLFDLMGAQALGRAFQQQQGPIPGLPGIGQQGPQAPMPGQASVPYQPVQPAPGPQPPGPMTQAGMGGPVAAQPPAAVAGSAGGAAGPPAGPMPMQGGPQPMQGPPPGMQQGGGGPGPQQGPPGQQQGMPQFDLQTLVARINQANPNLPPQAMVSALTRAIPLLNLQGRQDLAQLRMEMQRQGLDLKGAALDARERADDRRFGLQERREDRLAKKDEQQAATGLSPEAIDDAAQRYLKTGQLPSLGWGSQARQDKAAILNVATQKRAAAGLPVDKMIKDQQKLKAEQIAIQRFESGPQGNTVRSLGVVVDHLATMRDLGSALENGNVPIFNRIAQAWAEQTGNPAPTNFDTAKQIVGAEIIKALGVAGAGTQAEREEAANAFNRARTPAQLNGAIQTAQKLLAGQLKGLRRQFIQSTGLPGEAFDNMIGPEALGFLGPDQQRTAPSPTVAPAPSPVYPAPRASFNDRFQGTDAPPPAVNAGGWSAQRVQ